MIFRSKELEAGLRSEIEDMSELGWICAQKGLSRPDGWRIVIRHLTLKSGYDGVEGECVFQGL